MICEHAATAQQPLWGGRGRTSPEEGPASVLQASLWLGAESALPKIDTQSVYGVGFDEAVTVILVQVAVRVDPVAVASACGPSHM